MGAAMPNDMLPMNQRSKSLKPVPARTAAAPKKRVPAPVVPPPTTLIDDAPERDRQASTVPEPIVLMPMEPVQEAPGEAEAVGATLPTPEAPKPLLGVEDIPTEVQDKDLVITLDPRVYKVRGWEKSLSPETLRVLIRVTADDRFHVDHFDLYHAKARTAFIRQASVELGTSEDAIKRDLGKVLRVVERYQADQLQKTLATKDQRPPMSDQERAEALAWLKAPDLMARILQDFQALGVVGEESNKLTAYIAGVSRLLDRPLALVVQSASSAGKTSLIDAVLDLMPPEDLVRYSAMSSQSLFYMGNRNLKNKILSIAEEEGAHKAAYALKLLQSEGKVSMASTGKDAATGMLTAHEYTVEGPVSLFMTTTQVDLDEELLNRSLVLTVNESRDQTRAIHGVQRHRETLEGLLGRSDRHQIIQLHRNAQRLLQPLAVVNPYSHQLTFRDDQTRSRRDFVKYMTLIRSIALLHQFQREVKAVNHHGQTVHFIEVTPSDIEMANALAQDLFSRVGDVLPQTRKLLMELHAWVGRCCQETGIPQSDFRFTRRQVREALGWGDTQLRLHLDRLKGMEFIYAHGGRKGQRFSYELVYQGEDAHGHARVSGLIDPAQLQPVPETSRGCMGNLAGGGGVFAGTSRVEEALVG